MFKRFWWVFLGTAVLGPVVGIVLAAVVTNAMPKLYQSEGIIEVKQRSAGTLTPQFFATEFEKIKGRNALEKVVDNLSLTTRWGMDKETAIRTLKGSVSTQHISGTDLISIRALHTNKVDASDIADGVCRSYMVYRAEIGNRDVEKTLSELNKAIDEQNGRVQERDAALAKLTKNMEAHPHPLPHDEAADTPEEAATRAQDSQDLADAKRDLETEKNLLEKMMFMKIAATPHEPSLGYNSEPVINDSPVSPNVTLNLILGSVLGFLLSPLLALPLIVVLNRPKAH